MAKIKTVGDVRKLLEKHDDDAPIEVFSWVSVDDEDDHDDVLNHEILSINTGWYVDDKRAVNICICREFIKEK